ncbi:hypothetical protein BO70DRAFT_430337 [Aspergillus heteromorphus CBS 117.55]|uniref:Phosphoribosyltransferase domain-containing protein n=1 Tax=Aspergillus heteromorphus CBS 117.55 TaxID=1448321 RepID=A0A317VU59_9EURO|nr:uncharacterized protein BO70DRAFT_430337 [Aspergillus heteromorphus CBS 117.55]PWY77395.1 hypothetical protein BO70DRAFT_430337 [Aspergillus heteromorphus CBS 117.55]
MDPAEPKLDPTDQHPPAKSTVIGIYGIPGAGKSYLLKQLRERLGTQTFSFYEGSEAINTITPGGLSAFKEMSGRDKRYWRGQAIEYIAKGGSGGTAIVTGHFMLSDHASQQPASVMTTRDLKTYTHILYLDTPADVVYRRREDDAERDRPRIPIAQLGEWSYHEKGELRKLCLKHNIMFMVMPDSLPRIVLLLQDFQRHDEYHNQKVADECLVEAVSAGKAYPEHVLLFDADKTMAPVDTGLEFWKHYDGATKSWDTLVELFDSPLVYSYSGFKQATLLYEQATDDDRYDELCQRVASATKLYPEITSFFRRVVRCDHIRIVVVTCGLRLVWEKVLAREGLADAVKVIGGGRISDGYVVTPRVKGDLVERLKTDYHGQVWAFGDSSLDIEMLSKAHHAIVVVGDGYSRSRNMDAALQKAIEKGLQARQVLLPGTAPLRLNTTVLPVTRLDDPVLIETLVAVKFKLIHATGKSATKLLQTPMRNAAVQGPSLRKAHHQVGWYLAFEYLADLLGVEEYRIAHVQGQMTIGHRLANEERMLIIGLMRGGLSMALGVNNVFGHASLLLVSKPEEVHLDHLQGKTIVLLVDSVVNNGKTVAEFFTRVRGLKGDVRIVVVAGVVQAQAVGRDGPLPAIAQDGGLTVVALRLSINRYTGTRGTDTGNRLFNTMDLP